MAVSDAAVPMSARVRTPVTNEPDLPLRANWVGQLPFLALALFMGAITTLVWLTRQHDADQQRTALINDVLWIEQTLRFKLDHNESSLQQLGPELFSGAPVSAQSEARLRHLLGPERGLIRILWIDPACRILGAIPPPADGGENESGAVAQAPSLTFDLARSGERPVYGPAYLAGGGDYRFEVHIPVRTNKGLLGIIVGVYSLSDLVVRELPWWFTERYRVAVLDPDGREIAAKSKIAPLASHSSYTMPFDPPGHGLTLRIIAYKNEARWVAVLLTGSILLLGIVIVWSIWQLRRQLARRLAAEVALREESAYRKAMEDALITGMRARDREGRLTYVNPAFCQMTGYSADELLGLKAPMPYWDPDRMEQTLELHKQILTRGTAPGGTELRLRHKNGEMIDVLILEAPLIDTQGHHTGWMGSVLDITERKRAREFARQQEERLQATSRLVTMGEMASTLAHELNQPLAAITSYNNGCINRLSAGEIDCDELIDIHEKLGRQAQRAGSIIRRVHDFVRRTEPKREPLDLNGVIRDAVGLLEADVRKRGMQLVTELPPQLPPVTADALMIEQVVINLVRNGMDAMRDSPVERRSVLIRTAFEGKQVSVSVADRGCGITTETAECLFQPFFTTKPEGMGMGLNICRSIAELHHGRLSFEPNADGGTIFMLTLPVESV